jgi:transposase InsO family protein
MKRKASTGCRFVKVGDAHRFFPPQPPTEVAHEVQEVIGQSPHAFGLGRSRWWLAGISQSLPWLARYSLSGVWRLLRRLGLRYKRGRDYVHSPDPAYETKLARLHLLRLVRQQDPDTSSPLVLVYADEFTYYRQPTLAAGYAPVGSDRPYARRSHRHNSKRRIAATTYVKLQHDFVYLAVVMDVFTRSLRGWQLSRFLDQSLTLDALQRALAHGRVPHIHHSDQGVQYAAHAYVAILEANQVRISMAEVGTAWQNGYAERIMRTLKEEEIDLADYQDFADTYAQIGHFIEQVYQNKRSHSSLGYLTPAEFEADWRQLHPPS